MTAGKWALLIVAILTAASAGLSTLPYGWAHITVTAMAATISAWSTASAIIIHQNAKGST